jgi:hypothetical protein
MFNKGKTMQEKVEKQQADLAMKRIKLAEMQTDLQIRGTREAMHNSEIARLRA